MPIPKWKTIQPDKWGRRFARQCPSCSGETFQVVKEKEREKKHRGQACG
jgi:hypothetical protein